MMMSSNVQSLKMQRSSMSQRKSGLSNARGLVATLAALLAYCALSAPSFAGDYEDTVKSFQAAEETSEFFSNTFAYVVFPTIGKGGIGIGGAHGAGRVYKQGSYVGDATVTQLTLGLQLGAHAVCQMIFLED